jgi:rRNA processing protein Krr1/Pno1
MLIKNENFSFETLNIKDYTKRHDLKIIRARIIGKGGKTLKTLNELTKCYFELEDNHIGIIGDVEYIKNAEEAVIAIIKGAKQSNVYSFLEKHQQKPVVDLGLK